MRVVSRNSVEWMLTDPSCMEVNSFIQLSSLEFDDVEGTVVALFDYIPNVMVCFSARHGVLKTLS